MERLLALAEEKGLDLAITAQVREDILTCLEHHPKASTWAFIFPAW